MWNDRKRDNEGDIGHERLSRIDKGQNRRSRMQRQAIDDEIEALREEYPGLSDAAIQAILKMS